MRQTLLRPPLSPSLGPPSPLISHRSAQPAPAAGNIPGRPRRILIQPAANIHSRASVLGLGDTPRESPRSHPADAMGIVHPVLRFIITLLLVALALASAGVVAFGTHPALAQYPSGLSWITLSRRLQWPLTSLCLVLCVALIALVVGGKRRAVWLVFLAPVLFLFYQRFAGDEFRRMAVLDNPPFVAADKAGFLKGESPAIR